MKNATYQLFIILVYLFLGSTAIQAAASLDLYGNFHTLGITVTIESADDPEGDMAAQVEYRADGSSESGPGFPLSRFL